MNPVDDEAGQEVDALLAAALASIRPGPVTRAGVAAGPALNALLSQVHADYGWAGIYRVALAAAKVATWESGRQRDQHPYRHFGSEGERQPDTPVGYRVSRFVVAVMQGDEATAWLEFCRWQPDEASPPSPEMRQALWNLLGRAWSRQAGEPLLWTIDPGTRWPPECDFCCHATAATMYRCRPFQMSSPPERGGVGPVVASYTDVERWYACRTCARWVNADDWAALWRRFATNPGRPTDGNSANVRALWEAFRRHRLPRPYRLPRERPNPSAGAERATP